MNTTFFLIRHGEVDNPKKIVYGRTQIPLSEEGKLQIRNLATKLKEENIKPDVIFSSDLKRTVQSTKEILKVFPKTPIIYSKDLEEVDIGGLLGRLLSWQDSIGDIYNAKECQEMNIERPESIINRQMKVIKKASTKYFSKTIFIVGHLQPLNFLIWKLLHPSEKKIAPITDILSKFRLEKDQAWKVVLDEKLKVLEYSLVC